MNRRKKTDWRSSRLCVLLLLLVSLPGAVRADLSSTYGFARISNNGAVDVGPQLLVDVISNDAYAAANQVLFKFRNEGPVASSICDVYFDDGTLLGMAGVIDSSGTSFSQGARPRDFPGGAALSPAFETTADFSADSDSPPQPNGVNPGEWVGIIFNLKPGKTFASVIEAIGLGLSNPWDENSLRIGIHVQGLPDNDESDLFLHAPVPTAVLLGLLGLGAAGLKLRRFA